MAVDNGVDALTRQMNNMNMTDNDNTNRRPGNSNMSYLSLRDAAETILPFDAKTYPYHSLQIAACTQRTCSRLRQNMALFR